MKAKILAYAFIPAVLSFGFVGSTIASAQGMFGGASNLTPDQIAQRQTEMFQEEATILGISVADLKAEWAAGKTFKQIIADKNLNETDIKARMATSQAAHMRTQLQTLVDKGIITQDQADSRLKFMQDKMNSGKGFGRGRGHGMMRPFGF